MTDHHQQQQYQALLESLKLVGQEHLLKFYNQLSDELKAALLADLNETPFAALSEIFVQQVASQVDNCGNTKPIAKIDDKSIEPLPDGSVEGAAMIDADKLSQYRQVGERAIGEGKVAALLLAGGQGTRLGVSYPKGMYDIGLKSHKSLFELQANRIDSRKNIDQVRWLRQEAGQNIDVSPIRWYIMVSGPTIRQTKQFFETNNYFGLNSNNVVMFEQNTIPSFDFNGKILLDERHKLSKSPNGNGGLYEVLHERSILEDMTQNGIEYVHTYCVDNVLVRVCDPDFIGYCISKQVDIGAKVVNKVDPTEAVGTICKVDNKFKVIEYSEIPDSISQLRDSNTGKLVFNSGNICDHFFSVSFLKTIDPSRKPLPYHAAVKKIPHILLKTGERVSPTKPNGVKLEKFIFDVFELTDSFAAWQVDRELEFSPLKNPIGSAKDNPATALESIRRALKLGIQL